MLFTFKHEDRLTERSALPLNTILSKSGVRGQGFNCAGGGFPHSIAACNPSPNSWPGVLFTAAAGGVLALSWHSITIRWPSVGDCHLGFASTETKLFSVFLYSSCGLHMSVAASSWLWHLVQVEGFDDVQRETSNQHQRQHLCFVYSVFYLHATVIDTLERFPWCSNLTDIFSAVPL